MNDQEATSRLTAAVAVTREDIARAKTYVLAYGAGETDALAERWLREQSLVIPRSIDGDGPNLEDVLAGVARAISVRLALYQAVWELITAAELIPAGSTETWQPAMDYWSRRQGSGLRPKVACSYPSRVERPPLASTPVTDPDVFLQGVNCERLHPGILEAVEQALGCFRRGLYLPATAMLAAAAEATWIECGRAVAKKLNNEKLEKVVSDPLSGIGKIVLETRKVLEHPDGKELLKSVGQHITKVTDAEVWTTTLRERRNALHWGKNKSFVADHSETGTLLMGAPMHLGTLETIRAAC